MLALTPQIHGRARTHSRPPSAAREAAEREAQNKSPSNPRPRHPSRRARTCFVFPPAAQIKIRRRSPERGSVRFAEGGRAAS